jgi:hypothetical protein
MLRSLGWLLALFGGRRPKRSFTLLRFLSLYLGLLRRLLGYALVLLGLRLLASCLNGSLALNIPVF